MSHPIFSVDPSAFARYPWQDVIAAADPKLCHEYYEGFGAEAKKLASAGDRVGEQVYGSLNSICTFSFQPQRKGDNPYDAMWRETTSRSAHPDDLGPDGLNLIRTLAPTVTDPDLRGRLFDLVWILGRDFKGVAEAARAYTDTAAELAHNGVWRLMVVRIERALQLGGRAGRAKAPFTDTVKIIEQALTARQSTEDEFISADLLTLLLEQSVGDAARWAHLSETG